MLKIRLYDETKDAAVLFDMMCLEDDWGEYCSDKTAEEKFKTALKKDTAYVAYEEDNLCGFIRVYNDNGYSTFIMDLLVHKNYRGKSYGKALIDQVCKDFKDGTIYVLSDNDKYYQKINCKKIAGSVIIVRE